MNQVEIVMLKGKNVTNNIMKKILFLILLFPLTAFIQEKELPKLSVEQYEILNKLFPKEASFTLLRYTSFPIHLDYFLTKEHFEMDGGFCRLTEDPFEKSDLWDYLDSEDFEYIKDNISLLGEAYELEQRKLIYPNVQLVDRYLNNHIHLISAPIIKGRFSIIHHVHSFIEKIIFFEKDENGYWEILCEVYIKLDLVDFGN